MLKIHSIYFAIAFLVLSTSPLAVADEVVAIVDMEFVEETEIVAAVLCFGDDESDCGPWAHYYVFRATPTRVLRGELPDEPFLVVLGRHALKKQDLYDFVAMLDKWEADEPAGVEYRVSGWGERLQMYCFDRRDGDEYELAVELDGGDQLKCFDPEHF
ncbi:MAG: hypothetical protein AAGA44_13800 [Pseudomonadota bacterium]